MSEPLATATVTIDGNTDGVRDAVEEAKQEIESLDGGVKKTSSSFGRLGAAARVASRAMGAIALPIAVIASVTKLVSLMVEVRKESERFESKLKEISNASQDRTQKILQEASGISDVEQRVLQIQEQGRLEAVKLTEELDKELDKFIRRGIKDNSAFYQVVLGGATSEDLIRDTEKQIAVVENATNNAVAKIRSKAKAEAIEAAQKEAQEVAAAKAAATLRATESILGVLSSRSEGLAIDLLPDEEQIKARADAAIREAERAAREAGVDQDQDIQDALNRYRDLVRQKEQIDTESNEERIRRETAAEIKKGQEVAKANADAMAREIEAVQDRIRASFGFDASSLEQVAAAIDRHAATSRDGRL